jgi:hypothetical protein
MQLRDYLHTRGLTLQAMADLITAVEPRMAPPMGISTVQKHADGRFMPGKEFVRRYRIVTNNMVTEHDFADLYYSKTTPPPPAPDATPAEAATQ